MFEHIIDSLEKELVNLRAKRDKCLELMEKVQDEERKARLSVQYDVIRQAIDRAALCKDILGYCVALEISEDWRMVKFI